MPSPLDHARRTLAAALSLSLAVGPVAAAEIERPAVGQAPASPAGLPVPAPALAAPSFEALPAGSPFAGEAARAGASGAAAIVEAVKAQTQGKEEYVSLALKGAGSSGMIRFAVDPQLRAKLAEMGVDETRAFLTKLFEDAPFAHGEALRALSESNEPMTVALLDRSRGLVESDAARRFVGVNRALFEGAGDKDTRRAVLTIGLSHELRRMAEPAVPAADLTAADAKLLVHLSEKPWLLPPGWLAAAAGTPAGSPLAAAVDALLGRMRGADEEGARLRVEHLATSGRGSRWRMEQAKDGIAALEKAAPNEPGFWGAVERVVSPLSGASATAFFAHALPALAEKLSGQAALSSALAVSAAAVEKIPAGAIEDGLAPIVALVGADVARLERALGLLSRASDTMPAEARRSMDFGVYPRAQTMLAEAPQRLESFLYISELFGRNGMDPLRPQVFLRRVAAQWSIPQSWNVYPSVRFVKGQPVGFAADDDGQAREVAAFALWAAQLTDGRFAFPVSASADGERALRSALAALAREGVAASIEGAGGSLTVTLNPANRPAAEILAELTRPRAKLAAAAAPAKSGAWTAVTPAETRDAVIAMDLAVDYVRADHVAEEQKIHRYQWYSDPAPFALAAVYPDRAPALLSRAESELAELKGKIEWKSWVYSMRKLGDALLASGDRDHAKEIYAQAADQQTGFDIAMSLAKAGEHQEALKHLDLMAGRISAGVPYGTEIKELRWKLDELRRAVAALPAAETPAYRLRVERIARKLVNLELAELDENLERQVADWSRPDLEIPAIEKTGLAAFLENVWLSPRRDNTFDFADNVDRALPDAPGHTRLLENLWHLIKAASEDPGHGWLVPVVGRLWDSPVKAALYGLLAEKAQGADRDALLAMRDAARRRYEDASPIRASERSGAAVPGRETTIWESNVFGHQNGGSGFRLKTQDPRVARLGDLTERLRGGDASGYAPAKALAEELAEPFLSGDLNDGIQLLRFGALRDFLYASIAAGRLDDAEALSVKLSTRLVGRGGLLARQAAEFEKSGKKGTSGLNLKWAAQRLVKMSTALGEQARALIALKRADAGQAAAVLGSYAGLEDSYRRFPEAYDDALMLQAARTLAESPALAPAASAIIRVAVEHGAKELQGHEPSFGALQRVAETVAASPNLDRARLMEAAIVPIAASGPGSKEHVGRIEMDRYLKALLALLNLTKADPALAGSRARVLATIRETLERSGFNPAADILEKGAAPTGWSRQMVELTQLLMDGPLGALDAARLQALAAAAQGDQAYQGAVARLSAAR